MLTKLEDIPIYRIASNLSDYVWDIVIKWEYFAKKTIGEQFVEAIDSIAANFAEGFGRFHKKDKIKFYYNSRATVYESSFWCKKAFIRKLLMEEEYNHIIGELRKMPKELNYQIKITSINLKV